MNEIIKNLNNLNERQYYSIEEVLSILSISDNTLYKYIRKGDLKPVKLFRRNWFKGKELLDYIHSKIENESVSE